MGVEIPQGDMNTNLITDTITSILAHLKAHNGRARQLGLDERIRTRPSPHARDAHSESPRASEPAAPHCPNPPWAPPVVDFRSLKGCPRGTVA